MCNHQKLAFDWKEGCIALFTFIGHGMQMRVRTVRHWKELAFVPDPIT